MQWLAAICVRRPVLASVLVLLLVVVGLFGYGDLGVDRFPKIDFPFVVVTTRLPGSAPEEVEREISDRLEQALNTISGLDELRSVSNEGVSVVFASFNLEKDVDVAVSEVQDKVNGVLPLLPFGVERPTVSKLDPDAAPILAIAVSAPESVREITEWSDRWLRRRLESLKGVGQVLVVGGRARQVNVALDPERLTAYRLSPPEVVGAIQAQNLEVPGGALEEGARNVTVRTRGRVDSIPELRHMVVTSRGGAGVRLEDIGTVEDGEEAPLSVAQVDGEPAVVLLVRKQSGTNTVEVAGLVKDKLAELGSSLPHGTRLRVVRDQSVYIQAAIKSVLEHLIVGSCLAALVVLVFLWNGRSTLISAIAIPTSVISTFGLMWAMGFTLNVLTLLALTLSVGIVIDDAIVVLENIYRHIEDKGKLPFQAAIDGTKEIGLAVLATTLSLAIIFVPVAFMSGIIGRFMHSFGLTMAFAVLVSLFVSFTLTPMLSARFLKPHKAGKKVDPNGRRLERLYGRMLTFCLRRRWVVGLAALASIGMAVPVVKAMRKNFLPIDDESQFQVNIQAPEGTSLEQTALFAQRIARQLRRDPLVDLTLTTIGDDAAHTPNLANVYVHLVDVSHRDESQEAIMDRVRQTIVPRLKEAQPDLRIAVQLVNAFSGGARREAPLQMFISGPDFGKLEEYAGKILKHLRSVPGATDVDTSLVGQRPELSLEIDRDRAAKLGVTVADVAQSVRFSVAGFEVSRYHESGEQYPVFVRAPAAYRADEEGLRAITVPSRLLGAVRLVDVVRFRSSDGPSVIERLGRRRQVTISCNLLPGASMAAITGSLDSYVESLKLDPSYVTGYVGQSKEQGRAAKAFLTAFALSFVFMYLVLAAQFESWIHPITILVSLPLTVPFAVLSLYVLGDSLNIFSSLGIFVLFGVVKKNGILQVDRTLQLRAQGLSRNDAILEACKTRLRPILMTTIAFVAGMIPLVVSRGVGQGTNRTTGSVILGGQMLSLLLTLLATPVVYSVLDDASRLWSAMWRAIFRAFGRDEPEPEPAGARPPPVAGARPPPVQT